MIQMPSHWNRVPLGSISRVVTGRTPVTSEKRYWDGPVPFITPGDLNGNLILKAERTITQSGLEVSKGLPRGTVLVSCIGYVGKVGMVGCPVAATNQQINAVIPDESKVDNWYLLFAFMFLEPYFNNLARVTTVPILNKSNFEAALIPLPPLPEQRAIARALRAVQAAREARQRELALERERKAALMDHLFTHGTRGEPTRQTPIGEMPESWEVVKLGEIVRQKITDGVHQTPEYVDNGIPFVTAKDIVDNRIDFSQCARITDEEHRILSQRVHPETGDVLLTKVGTVGNVALVNGGQEFSIFVQVALIKPKPVEVESGYLFYALQSQDVQSEIRKRSSLSTMQFIGTQKIATVKVPIASRDEQRAIARVLSVCDAKIAALNRESALLDELFRALLEALMSGRVSTRALTWENEVS